MVADGYKAGETGFEIHVRIRARDGNRDTQYFLARIWRLSGGGIVGVEPTARVQNRLAISKLIQRRNRDIPLGRNDVCQLSPVLNDVREAVESGERLQGMQHTSSTFGGVHFEWLEVFELVGVSVVHVFPIDVRRIRPLGFVEHDRELDLLDNVFIGRYDSVVMPDRQLPREMIEGAPEIVDRISSDRTPVIRGVYDALNAVDKRAPCGIILSSDGQKFTIRTSFGDLGSKDADVFFGAFELKQGTTEVEAW